MHPESHNLLQFQEDIKSCKKFVPAKYLIMFHFSAD